MNITAGKILLESEARQIPSSALAYLGDSVIEIMVREKLVLGGAKNPSVKSLEYVTAPAQSDAVEKIAPLLTDVEDDVFRRGRNSVHSGVPKHASVAQYRRATGLECLFGYLYISGQNERARELFEIGFAKSPEESKE